MKNLRLLLAAFFIFAALFFAPRQADATTCVLPYPNAPPLYTSADPNVVWGNFNALAACLLITPQSATATLSTVASSASSVTLLASNSIRKGMIIYNNSTQFLYLAFAASASTSVFTYPIPPGAIYENSGLDTLYTGKVTGIWPSANGSAIITEEK